MIVAVQQRWRIRANRSVLKSFLTEKNSDQYYRNSIALVSLLSQYYRNSVSTIAILLR